MPVHVRMTKPLIWRAQQHAARWPCADRARSRCCGRRHEHDLRPERARRLPRLGLWSKGSL